MPYFVYILQSTITQKYYCGQTDNLQARLGRHNQGLVKSTKHGIPWVMVGYLQIETRAEAMAIEKVVKGRGISRWVGENDNKLNKPPL
jgi:putative endonuclease